MKYILALLILCGVILYSVEAKEALSPPKCNIYEPRYDDAGDALPDFVSCLATKGMILFSVAPSRGEQFLQNHDLNNGIRKRVHVVLVGSVPWVIVTERLPLPRGVWPMKQIFKNITEAEVNSLLAQPTQYPRGPNAD